MREEGYVQVYTGSGKGKTTASLGLALRANCAGDKVLMIQFMKGMNYAELKAGDFLPHFTIEQYGLDHFIMNQPTEEDQAIAFKGIARAQEAMKKEECDVLILDEINNATFLDLIKVEDVLGLIKNKPAHMELVLTGRYADPKVIEAADLVTEMKEIKHYYTQGVMAREGIEY